MKSLQGVGAFSKRLMITQASVTQQIFEERKKTINSILVKSGAKPNGVRNRTKTPNRGGPTTLETVHQLNLDL
jgi:hypothetical protein